jgi:hypothetical protein
MVNRPSSEFAHISSDPKKSQNMGNLGKVSWIVSPTPDRLGDTNLAQACHQQKQKLILKAAERMSRIKG